MPEPTCPFGPCLYGSFLNDFGCPTCDCLKSAEYERKECFKPKCMPCKNGRLKFYFLKDGSIYILFKYKIINYNLFAKSN